MSSSEGKDKQNLKWRFKVSRFQIWVDKVIWEMSTLQVSSSGGGQGQTAKIWDAALKV